MGKVIARCGNCGINFIRMVDIYLCPTGKLVFFCEKCDKEREMDAKLSNLIGNTPSVALLKRLKADKEPIPHKEINWS